MKPLQFEDSYKQLPDGVEIRKELFSVYSHVDKDGYGLFVKWDDKTIAYEQSLNSKGESCGQLEKEVLGIFDEYLTEVEKAVLDAVEKVKNRRAPNQTPNKGEPMEMF